MIVWVTPDILAEPLRKKLKAVGEKLKIPVKIFENEGGVLGSSYGASWKLTKRVRAHDHSMALHGTESGESKAKRRKIIDGKDDGEDDGDDYDDDDHDDHDDKDAAGDDGNDDDDDVGDDNDGGDDDDGDYDDKDNDGVDDNDNDSVKRTRRSLERDKINDPEADYTKRLSGDINCKGETFENNGKGSQDEGDVTQCDEEEIDNDTDDDNDDDNDDVCRKFLHDVIYSKDFEKKCVRHEQKQRQRLKDLYSLKGYLPKAKRSKKCMKEFDIPTKDSSCVTMPSRAKLSTPYKFREYLTLQDPAIRNANFIFESKLPPIGSQDIASNLGEDKVVAGAVLTRAQKRNRADEPNERRAEKGNEKIMNETKFDKTGEEGEKIRIDKKTKSRNQKPCSKMRQGPREECKNTDDLQETRIEDKNRKKQTDEDTEPKKSESNGNDKEDIRDYLEKSLKEDIFKQG